MKSGGKYCFAFVLLVVFLLTAKTAYSRIQTDPYRLYSYNNSAPQGWVVSAYSIFSYVDYREQPGNLFVKFPYILTNRSTGTASTSIFTATSPNLVRSGKWVYPGIGLELGKENFSVEAAMGLYLRQWSDHLYFGVNYRFILNKIHANPERYTFGATSFPGKRGAGRMGDFPIKISCGFFYWQPIWNLGTINIGDKEFYALGHVMQDRDSLNVASSGNITVLFHQNYIALTPNINIGYRPQQGRIDFSFRVSPLITIAERGGLRFYLRNGGSSEWAPTNGISLESVIPLDSVPMNATFNGENIDTSPFRLRGIMYTFRIGIRII